MQKTGRLILVATPIGNMADLSFRALETLCSVDLIAAEDTRHSGKLLKEYNIQTKMISLHKFNEAERRQTLLQLLSEGKQIALISDAGTPGICDPGADIIRACIAEEIDISIVPGANAAVSALAVSGLSDKPFTFLGFFPKKSPQAVLDEISASIYTTVFYEAPHRIKKTLQLFSASLPSRQLVLVRELTKYYEEVLRGTADSLLAHLPAEVKGELVLIVQGAGEAPPEIDREAALSLVNAFLKRGYKHSEAVRLAAKELGIKKNALYHLTLDQGLSNEENPVSE